MNTKPTIRITRSNFPNQSMLYWMSYFLKILEKKYDVIVDTENPDIVFWTNIHSSTEQIDLFTNKLGTSHNQYPNAKKIFCSCEMVPNHMEIINLGDDYFVIGPEPILHPRYLYLPTHNTVSAWGLYDESKLFDDPYNWLTEHRDGEKILSEKKHFCGVVQNSKVIMRQEIFDKLSEYKFVRASGGWITNVPPNEQVVSVTNDGETYKNKINFLRTCKFSMQIQSNVLRYLTVEKLIHGFASETIPIYYGNDSVLLDGFNPKSFINCHEYKTVDEIVERVIEIDKDDKLFKEMISEPIFLGNVLPYYFDHNYVLNFFEKIINLHSKIGEIIVSNLKFDNLKNVDKEYTTFTTETSVEIKNNSNPKKIALVSLFFDYPIDRMPLIYDNAVKYFDKNDIFIARFDGLPQDSSYYEKLYTYKISKLLPFIKQNIVQNYEYMIFVDATDTNFYRAPSDIIEIFESFNKSIVFCAEKELWPSTPYDHFYDEKDIKGPFKYLNSGCYIGYTNKIVEHLENIIKNNYVARVEDQSAWTIEYLLSEDIDIDSESKLFFSTHLNKKYVNLENNKISLNGLNPFIIHDNGPYSEETFKFTNLL
jgi:hypothetical protein